TPGPIGRCSDAAGSRGRHHLAATLKARRRKPAYREIGGGDFLPDRGGVIFRVIHQRRPERLIAGKYQEEVSRCDEFDAEKGSEPVHVDLAPGTRVVWLPSCARVEISVRPEHGEFYSPKSGWGGDPGDRA